LELNCFKAKAAKLKILFSIVIAFTAGPLWATDPENPPETIEQKFLESNIAVSQWLDGVAEGIDMYLVGKKLTRRKNETYVRLENSTFVREREGQQNVTSINANLRLPNVEEYWQLKFTSYDESRERRISEIGNLRRTPRDRDLGASIGLFRKLGNIRTAFQPRVALQNSLKISHSLTFESIADLETYSVNPKFQFFADAEQGAGLYGALNADFRISRDWTLTVINDAEYKDRPHLFTVTNGISFGELLSRRSAISYNFITDSNNLEAYHLEAYSLSVTWSQLVYKQILDFSLSPSYIFPRANNYQGAPGFTLTFDVTF
jgi:hypothetical protein